MKVVSNTSPIIFLGHVNSLEILSSCFNKILIPKAVATELKAKQLPSMLESCQISVAGESFVNAHFGALHRGELEAIQLAREVNADLVLLDDLLARNKAKELNVSAMGTLGIFLFACRQGHISPQSAARKIDILISEHDMYVASNLLRKIKDELESLE
jgi:predicted nucleic acid-binding protein